MPALEWIGKSAVLNHHRQVPYHLLRCDEGLSVGDPASGNLLIQGDNLLALKALLPYYAGQVKCIYIDPPYNTGNEHWIYNDNVNSAEIRRWLGKAVGGEAEDLSRHDKWLCMMYPRLRLLWQFLREDGVMFMSIDDNELTNASLMLDEIFGPNNFVATLPWQKRVSPANDAKYFSSDHEYVIVYAKQKRTWRPNRLSRTETQLKNYSNPDNDPRGPWNSATYTCNKSVEERPNLYHPLTNPNTGDTILPRKTAVWKYDVEAYRRHVAEERLWWGKSGTAKKPRLKVFLSEVHDVVPRSLLMYSEYGHTQEARTELLRMIPDAPFTTPKPVRLIQRLLEIGSDRDSLVLDSFAGSGTTGHAAWALNGQDGGCRRVLLVEMEEAIATSITQPRLRKAILGYEWETAQGQARKCEGLGGSFRFCRLETPVFDEHGNLHPEVRFADLATHVFFSETGVPIANREPGSPLLGAHAGAAVYLLFNGILGDKTVSGGNVLTRAVLNSLPKHDGRKVVYGEGCRLSVSTLKRLGITFKQIPYQIGLE